MTSIDAFKEFIDALKRTPKSRLKKILMRFSKEKIL
jgi:hypothetical protein